MTTSKRILWLDIAVAIIVTVAVLVGGFTGHDMSNAAIVAGLWDAQLAAVVGFYLWKSKNENRSKYAMELVERLAEKYGIENVVELAQVVLKD